jgi:ketosteroid isomerase-like protein
VGREELELVAKLQAMVPVGDVGPLIDDESLQASLSTIVDPDAEMRWVDTESGALGDFRPPERGIEGLRAGWREWKEAWEDFRIRFEQNLDAGHGQVLSLAELRGRVRGGPEISQPGAALIRIREGRIVAMHFYLDREQARREAGLS